MKLHRESKGTITVATIAIAILSFLAIYFLEMWSLIVIIPLLVLYGLVFWFFRVPARDIQDHKENVIAPVDGKVVMIKEVHEDEFLNGKGLFTQLIIKVSLGSNPLMFNSGISPMEVDFPLPVFPSIRIFDILFEFFIVLINWLYYSHHLSYW